MKNKKRCPKCGFTLTQNYGVKPYCVRCGYTENVFLYDMNKYNSKESDLQLFFKDEQESYIHNQNTFLIFILGPLFFAYSGFFWLGMILTFFSLRIGFLIYYNLGFIIFFSIFLFIRFLYMTFLNTIVLILIKYKIKILKKYFKNYKELIEKHKQTSIIYVFLAFVMAILLSIIVYL